jgi:hypothetical protein
MGFNVPTVANKHKCDYGLTALKSTIDKISDVGCIFLDVESSFESIYSYRILEKEGVRLCTISAAVAEFGVCMEEGVSGYDYINHSSIDARVRSLTKVFDEVVLITYVGVEKIDVPSPKWRDRYSQLCGLGVDCIVGHHPHVPQEYEEYRSSLIFYSLGNFYSDTAGYVEDSNDPYSVILDVNKDSSITFKIIYHKTINSQVIMVDETYVNFTEDNLNAKLFNYSEYLNSLIVDLYETRYLSYYKYSFLGAPEKFDILGFIKAIVRPFFSRRHALKHRWL